VGSRLSFATGSSEPRHTSQRAAGQSRAALNFFTSSRAWPDNPFALRHGPVCGKTADSEVRSWVPNRAKPAIARSADTLT